MFLSKEKNGFYYLYYFENGKRKKLSTRTKIKSEALKFIREFIPSSNSFRKPDTSSLPEIFDRVLQFVQSNHSNSTFKIYKAAANRLMELYGTNPISIYPADCGEIFKEFRLKTVNKTTINIEIRSLKSFFNIAMELGLIYENPFTRCRLFKIDQKEILCFTDTEIEQIFRSELEPELKDIVIFALNTGCRISEIVNLQWSDVNFAEGIVSIVNKENFHTKSRKIRYIPMSDAVAELLSGYLRENDTLKLIIPEEYVFNNAGSRYSRGYFSLRFKEKLRNIGMPEKYHFHCLRHTFITKLIKSGVNINYVKEIAGHSDINTTMKYIHISFNDYREVVNRLNFKSS